MNAKVYRIDPGALAAVLRGERRIRNLPRDAQIVADHQHADPRGGYIAWRIHSHSFPDLPAGAQLPVVVAVTEPMEQTQRAAA